MKKKRKRIESNGWVKVGKRKRLNKEDLEGVTVVVEGTGNTRFHLNDKTFK